MPRRTGLKWSLHGQVLVTLLFMLVGSVAVATSHAPLVAQEFQVIIIDDDFTPPSLSVPIGARVTWTNSGFSRHDVVALRGGFRSSRLSKGESFGFTFSTPGSFDYECTVHRTMAGTIDVGGSTSPAPAMASASSSVAPGTAVAAASVPAMTMAAGPTVAAVFSISALPDVPRAYTLDELRAQPVDDVSVEAASGEAVQQRTYRGVRLHTLLTAVVPGDAPVTRVRIEGIAGEAVTLDWAAILPDGVQAAALVAFESGGLPLAAEDGPTALILPSEVANRIRVRGIAAVTLLTEP